MERLQKVIAASGMASRRKAEELIVQGRVKVNGEVVTRLGTQVSRHDEVTVDGRPLVKEEPEYYLLNKPKKVICSAADEKGRPVVTDLIATDARIYPVGRLDYDSTGLLILTNDGAFANLLMHPRYHVPKTYHVTVEGAVSRRDLEKIRKGVRLPDGTATLPAEVEVTNYEKNSDKTSLNIVLTEGRNREIRRMMEALGHPVTRLHRSAYGPVKDDQLPIGSYRRLKPHEMAQLREMAQGEAE